MNYNYLHIDEKSLGYKELLQNCIVHEDVQNNNASPNVKPILKKTDSKEDYLNVIIYLLLIST